MKRFLSGTLMQRNRKEISSFQSEANYENAMRVYKIFAYVSGAVVTAAYVISLIF